MILFNTSDTFRLNEILCELKLLCVSVLHVLTAHTCLKVVSVFQAEGEDSLKKMQLMELAILNGTYRDASIKTCKRQTGQSDSHFKHESFVPNVLVKMKNMKHAVF